MRFFLFGQGEGVRTDSQAVLWASVKDGKITDASISARKQGARPGMTAKAVQALVPGIVLHEESETSNPSETMKRIWEILWGVSPWLETVSEDAFLVQIPSARLPIREVRDLLLAIQKLLNEEQRFRLGLAENPFLARALVEWSRFERVPHAGYFKVRGQELLLSPGISEIRGTGMANPCMVNTDWVRQLPISALWVLPAPTQITLWELGIRRLSDLETVGLRQLQQRFGSTALMWLEWLNQHPGGRVNVNYPPAELFQSRQAEVGEQLPSAQYQGLLESMAQTLARELERSGTGARKVGIAWETPRDGRKQFEKVAKRLVYQPELLLAQVQSAIEVLPDEGTERLELYVKNLQPLSSVQLTFWREETKERLFTEHDTERERPGRERFRLAVRQREEKHAQELEKLLRQVNKKFPNGLQVGVRPSFRELRLQAVLQGNVSTARWSEG